MGSSSRSRRYSETARGRGRGLSRRPPTRRRSERLVLASSSGRPPRSIGHPWSPPVGNDKEDQPRRVHCHEAAKETGAPVHGVKDPHGGHKADLLQHRRQHGRAKARRVGGDDQEQELPCQGHSEEAVVVLWMRNRRRIVLAGLPLQEKRRDDDQNARQAGRQEDPLGKSHGVAPPTNELPTAAGGKSPPADR